MGKRRSPSRQRRTERRKLERIKQKMARMSNRLDPTKWIGHVRCPETDEIIRIPRIVPEVGSMWRCELYDVKFLVRQVHGDRIVGQVWSSNRQLSTMMKRFRNSRRVNGIIRRTGQNPQDFFGRLRSDLPRLFNDSGETNGELTVYTLDFCGLDILIDHSLDEIIAGLSRGEPPENDRYHFRRIS